MIFSRFLQPFRPRDVIFSLLTSGPSLFIIRNLATFRYGRTWKETAMAYFEILLGALSYKYVSRLRPSNIVETIGPT
jgi:hypothetical protein